MFLGKSSLLGECDCRSTDAGQRNNIFVFVCFSSVTLQRHHREGVEHVIPKALVWLTKSSVKANLNLMNVATTIVQSSGLLGVKS